MAASSAIQLPYRAACTAIAVVPASIESSGASQPHLRGLSSATGDSAAWADGWATAVIPRDPLGRVGFDSISGRVFPRTGLSTYKRFVTLRRPHILPCRFAATYQGKLPAGQRARIVMRVSRYVGWPVEIGAIFRAPNDCHGPQPLLGAVCRRVRTVPSRATANTW